MDSFDLRDYAEATEQISIDGEQALVHHAQNPDLDQQEFAELIHETARQHEFSEKNETDETLLENSPEIARRVHYFLSVDFQMEFRQEDCDLDLDVVNALTNTFEYFSFNSDKWENSNYSEDNPTDAEVIAAFISIVNAVWCVKNLKNHIKENEDNDTDAIFSQGMFNVNVNQGLMTAFRDAFMTNSPKSPLQVVVLDEREHAISEAIENTLGIELSDAHLHGLLLAEWNQSVNLQAASTYGRQKSVEQGMKALEGLTNAIEDEAEAESD